MPRPRAIDRLRRRGRLRIVGYRSYGSPDRVVLRGRVLANRTVSSPRMDESRWRTAGRTAHRFLTREVSAVAVEATIGSTTVGVVTDQDGYFAADCDLDPPLDLHPSGWQGATVTLPGRPEEDRWTIETAIADPATTETVIISDIDDTLLVSEAGHLTRTLWATITGSAITRRAVPGAAELYRSLAAARPGTPPHPVFYVSSSPWNLYDFLCAFLDRNGFPKGPLLLRGIAANRRSWAAEAHHDHKVHSIGEILCVFPNAHAVLLGDSSQEDAVAFATVMGRHPGRISAAYIRDLGDAAKARRVQQVIAGLPDTSTPMVLAPDSAAMEAHADAIGLI
jgi:phosphatidate phosphatase APP1